MQKICTITCVEKYNNTTNEMDKSDKKNITKNFHPIKKL